MASLHSSHHSCFGDFLKLNCFLCGLYYYCCYIFQFFFNFLFICYIVQSIIELCSVLSNFIGFCKFALLHLFDRRTCFLYNVSNFCLIITFWRKWSESISFTNTWSIWFMVLWPGYIQVALCRCYVRIEYSLISHCLQKHIHITFHHFYLFLHFKCVYLLHHCILPPSLILHLGHQV